MKGLRAAVGVLALVLAGSVAAPASAHARWVGSDPQEGTVLAAPPAVVVMTYSEDIAPQFVDTAVVPPGGAPVPTEAVADGVDVTIDVAAALPGDAPAGTWQVVARVVSADGHPVEHTTTFEVEPGAAPAAGPTGEPTTAPSEGPGTGAGPTAASATGAGAEPTAVAGDPVAGVVEGLPGWASVLLGLGALGALAAVVVVQLRRRPPQA